MDSRFRLLHLLIPVVAGLVLALPSAAQSRVDVRGVVTDTLGTGLSGATVVLLQEADSVMVGYSITDREGAFRLRHVPAGAYLMQVTFVGLEPHTQAVAVADEPVEVGRIVLREAVAELNALVISAERVPVVLSGDTLTYNADAFSVRPGATVEDLLKRLPGVEVDRDGAIRSNGEDVRQVLVDGKEFFGDDPTIATQNLPADAVAKVQVYDKPSDMAAFTGVDDGEEQRTINLALKEDRRQGTFGTLSGGYGRDVDADRYEGRASLNRFSPSTQLSLLGNLNNINAQGFSPRQYLQFMGGMQEMMGGGGTVRLQLPGRGGEAGFTRTGVLGLNLNHDFGTKTAWRSSYFYNDIRTDLEQTVLQQQIAGASRTARGLQTGLQDRANANHRINLDVRHTLAEGHDVRLEANVQATASDLVDTSQRDTRDADARLANSSTTAYATDAREWDGDAALTYRRRLTAGGTSVVAELRTGFTDGDVDGRLDALNRFYDSGDLRTTEEIAQQQRQRSDLWSQRAQVSLTHPFTRRLALQARAEHRRVQETQEQAISDSIGDAWVRNDAFSSVLRQTYTYDVGDVTARWNRRRYAFSVGAAMQRASLVGTLREADDRIERSFVHLLPSATLRYEFPDGANMDLRYAATTREPSMRELQPFTDNSNPLNTYTGNPDLAPEVRHTAGLHFMFYDQFTFTNLFAYLQAEYTTNRIVRARTVDAQFRQASTSVNAGDGWTLNANINYGTPVRPLGLRLNASNRVVYDRGVELINGAENRARILRNTVNVRLENRAKERVDVLAGVRLTVNGARYSLNRALSQTYVNRAAYAEVAVRLGDAWRVATELDYRVFAEEVSGDVQRVPLWQVEMARSLLGQRAEVQLVALDLLDRNVGVSFDNQPTYIQETRVNTLGRYVMLRFVYTLTPGDRASGPSIRWSGE